MGYILKTFWPFPLYKKYFENVEAVLFHLDIVMDYAQTFYDSMDVDIDLESYIDREEGYRIHEVDLEKLYQTYSRRSDKIKYKLDQMVDKEIPLLVTSEMYRTDNKGNILTKQEHKFMRENEKHESCQKESREEVIIDTEGCGWSSSQIHTGMD